MAYENALIHETSPYLRQHAHNPVDWYPWGEAAFQKAREADRPVFLSIGYSACHWCHVMARESFEDPDAAAVLNRSFVSVKVDREERPDVDAVYMRACQAMTGGGGWPLSVFLTPDGEPFYAGTYFRRADFLRLLAAVARAWREDRAELLAGAGRLTQAVAADDGGTDKAEEVPTEAARRAFRGAFDPVWGGFGGAPKFPAGHNLLFLLETDADMAEKTLDAMYEGGLFDHLGGGFFRYATDRRWRVPHYEKMLYDNALLAMAYLTAYERTGRTRYAFAGTRTLDYMAARLRDADGGFFASQDADTAEGEGACYRFTAEEAAAVLGPEDGALYARLRGLLPAKEAPAGSLPRLAEEEAQDGALRALDARLLALRDRRPAPATDTKKLTAWNALTAAAFAFGARILGRADYLETAAETLDFMDRVLAPGGRVLAGITAGRPAGPGFLDDWAFYAFALLCAHQAAPDRTALLGRAAAAARGAHARFRDETGGGYFFSGTENERLLTRTRALWDGAMPSGNAVLAWCFSRLALLTGEDEFEALWQAQRRVMNGAAAAAPMGCGFYLWAALPVRSVVCVPGKDFDPAALKVRTDWAFRFARPGEYPQPAEKTLFYVCEGDRCLPPSEKVPE